MISSLAIKKIKLESLILISLIAVSIISPIAVHFVGLKGTEFLPIFFALSIGTFILSPIYLIALSILSPLVNYLIFQMPNVPILYFLMFEGIVFAIVITLMKNRNISFILVSLFALILGRLSSVILTFIFDVNINAWLNSVILGYKGVIINWIFASIMYLILKNKYNE